MIHSSLCVEASKVRLCRGISVVRFCSADKLVFIHGAHALRFRIGSQVPADFLLHEYIVVETCITVKDRHKSGNLCAVRYVIWRIPRGWQILSAVIYTGAYPGKGTCDQVVYKSGALCADAACAVGQKQIVVNQCGTVGNLDKNFPGRYRSIWNRKPHSPQ